MTGKGSPNKNKARYNKPGRERHAPRNNDRSRERNGPHEHKPARERNAPTRQGARIENRPPTDRASIYGLLPVLEALRANARRIDRIVVADTARERRLTEVYELAHKEGIRLDRVSRTAFDRLVDPDVNHQGVVAFAAAAEYIDVDNILDRPASEATLIVVLDGIEDPRNLGAILRSVECAGADGVVIPDRRAVGLTDTVAKSSAGAAEHVRVAKVTNLNRFIEELKERNIWVVGAAGEADMSYAEWDWNRPTALVLGSEGTGLHRLVAENCDVLVKIPMYGKIDSLNVSVAAGVILFEARRQRSKKD